MAVAAACCALWAGGCGNGGGGDERARRVPLPAPQVELTAADRAAWAPLAPDRSAVPVLLYRGVGHEAFARQMVLLERVGYDAIGLPELIRFLEGDEVRLPPRPFVLTFDGGRLATWVNTDGILARLGFSATLFVDVGRLDSAERDPAYLTWSELNRLQRGGRWDIQLRAGTGGHLIRYGPAAEDVGPFYAYRGSEERIDGWRERVFSDITDAERRLAFRLPGYRPRAFAPPFGNYGQAGTNDPRIPRLLFARLKLSFELVFTQDRSPFATPGAHATRPLGRFEVTPATTEAQLRELLTRPAR